MQFQLILMQLSVKKLILIIFYYLISYLSFLGTREESMYQVRWSTNFVVLKIYYKILYIFILAARRINY